MPKLLTLRARAGAPAASTCSAVCSARPMRPATRLPRASSASNTAALRDALYVDHACHPRKYAATMPTADVSRIVNVGEVRVERRETSSE